MDEFTVVHSTRRGQRGEDRTTRFWTVARKFVLGLSLALACQSALAQAMYRIKPLGYLGGCTTYTPTAAPLNKSDQVTGQACNAHGDDHAFLWKNDGTPMKDLGPPEVGSMSDGVGITASGLVGGWGDDGTNEFIFVSKGDGTPIKKILNDWGGNFIEAVAMNDLGQLVGSADKADFSSHAFVWKNDGSPFLDLGTLGGDFSDGYAINASGQVAGCSYTAGNSANHPFVWKNDGTLMHDLGTLAGGRCYSVVINASGQVAGVISVGKVSRELWHAFFWSNDGTPMQGLGTLGGKQSYVNTLNDSGQVVGWSDTLGLTNEHAFVWMNDGTPMKDLGTFGGTTSQANDINASGQVTGSANLAGDSVAHAFRWDNDGTKIQDLNKLIDPTDPLQRYVTLTQGGSINDLGDIVAYGTDSRTGLEDVYLLQGTVLTLAPRSLAFGNQRINTASAAKSVTMTNPSPKPVAISSVALTGAASGQFASTNNCGKSLAGHATCTIKVTFKPTTKGAKSAILNVNGGGGGLRVVILTGTGI
jgi:probable HAF family extracellular repeat protein